VRWCEVVECEVVGLKWWMSTTSFIISIQYVIIISNDVTRKCSDEIGQNLLSRHFLASFHVCDKINRGIQIGSSP
jgi:hypothetical protein